MPLPTPEQEQSLYSATLNGDLEAVSALLKDNPDLAFCKTENKTGFGFTALQQAALKRGWSNMISSPPGFGFTALHYATLKEHKDLVQLLIDNKAGVNVAAFVSQGGPGNTYDKGDRQMPLHLAAINDSKDLAELLLANGADINAKDYFGTTPLHMAVVNRHKNMVEFLLAKKSDVNVKDKSGATPLHAATVRSFSEIVELLRQYGGEDTLTTAMTIFDAAGLGYLETVKVLLTGNPELVQRNT